MSNKDIFIQNPFSQKMEKSSLSREEFLARTKSLSDWEYFRILKQWREAAISGDVDTINEMIPNMDINLQFADGNTALILASECGNNEGVKVLLQNNALIDCTNFTRTTPLFAAILNHHADTAEILIKNNANVNVYCSRQFMTPLICASWQGYGSIVEMLLDKNANIDAVDYSGDSALIWAVRANYYEIVRILLHNNANTSLINKEGDTALDIAIKKGHKEIQELLEME